MKNNIQPTVAINYKFGCSMLNDKVSTLLSPLIGSYQVCCICILNSKVDIAFSKQSNQLGIDLGYTRCIFGYKILNWPGKYIGIKI